MTTEINRTVDKTNHISSDLDRLSDDALVVETKRLASVARQATAELLALLIEVERRSLHLALGYSSMFLYCTRVLRLSEQATYNRITPARAARRFPQLLDLLADGALTLSSVGLLAPKLTDETADWMIGAACGKSTREVEKLIAAWFPQPDIPMSVRTPPSGSARSDASPASPLLDHIVEFDRESDRSEPASQGSSAPLLSAAPEQPRAVVAPLAPARYLLRLTIGQDTHDKLQRARALLRHAISDGDTDQILNRALSLLVDQLIRTKCAGVRTPRRTEVTVGRGRHIPAAVKREVWQRDGGRCVFAGGHGFCGETAFLEYHHVVPFAAGGPTDVGNLQLRCRAHNAYESAES
jgi:5-methylcytosine-specific restriction endonuclease McrA